MILYDTQYWGDALLEQQAFEKLDAVQLNPSATRAYLAFPWSELITALESNDSLKEELLVSLGHLQRKAEKFPQVASVCQHPHALRYSSLFTRVGVTHLFSTELQSIFHESTYAFSVLPFPKYFFSQALQERHNDLEQLAASPASKMIIETLDAFHQEVGCKIFSPCGWDVGLSFENFWEVLADGFIPVIPKVQLSLPGHPNLWSTALFTIDLDIFDAELLLLQLRELVNEKQELDRKRQAMQQLMFLYGPEALITDLLCFFVEPQDLMCSSLYFTHQLIYLVEEQVSDEFFLLSFFSRLLVNYDKTYNEVQHNAELSGYICKRLEQYRSSSLVRKIVNLTESKGWYLS